MELEGDGAVEFRCIDGELVGTLTDAAPPPRERGEGLGEKPVADRGDVEPRDDYGRLLAYVYRSSDGEFINLELAAEGAAVTLRIEPDPAGPPAPAPIAVAPPGHANEVICRPTFISPA